MAKRSDPLGCLVVKQGNILLPKISTFGSIEE